MSDPFLNPRSEKIKLGLVIVAAGRGARAKSDGPKQYNALAGRPVIARTMVSFLPFVEPAHSVIVYHADDTHRLEEALLHLEASNYLTTVGAPTRQGSVRAGLEALARQHPAITHVMIHDAARPCVSEALLDRIINHVKRNPDVAVLPVLPIAETVKRLDKGEVVASVPRADLALAQTPQTFPLSSILECHRAAEDKGRTDFTDDASLFEWRKYSVHIVDGETSNIKITYPEDFAAAEKHVMNNMQPDVTTPFLPDVRTGNGYDVHRFGPGNTVWLCGVAIPHTHTLSGHSDADVGLHALTDALLATCGAGDIGDHFPPSDSKWKGAASSIFLNHAAQIVRQAGGTIMNADVSIIAEEPKIAPHRETMCKRLAELLGIDRNRCSVKATTNERLGFVGRGEGIAAIATSTVVYKGQP